MKCEWDLRRSLTLNRHLLSSKNWDELGQWRFYFESSIFVERVRSYSLAFGIGIRASGPPDQKRNPFLSFFFFFFKFKLVSNYDEVYFMDNFNDNLLSQEWFWTKAIIIPFNTWHRSKQTRVGCSLNHGPKDHAIFLSIK